MKSSLVCYHYIRNDEHRINNYPVHSITPEQFIGQIRFCLERLKPLHPNDIEAACHFGKVVNNGFLLSFDDGLWEHFHVVLPILEDFGLKALFFPHIMPYRDGRAPFVNLLQVLIGREKEDKLIDHLLDRLRLEDGYETLDSLPVAAKRIKRLDGPRTNDIKYFLNFTLNRELSQTIIEDLYTNLVGPIEQFIRDNYLTVDELKALSTAGMEIGAHTSSHPYLSSLDEDAQQEEMRTSIEYLEILTGQPIRYFAYPFGNYDDRTKAIADRCGLTAAFSTEPVSNLGMEHRYSIGRIDTVFLEQDENHGIGTP